MNKRLMRADTRSHARAAERWNTYWKQGVAELHHYRTQLRLTKDQRWTVDEVDLVLRPMRDDRG